METALTSVCIKVMIYRTCNRVSIKFMLLKVKAVRAQLLATLPELLQTTKTRGADSYFVNIYGKVLSKKAGQSLAQSPCAGPAGLQLGKCHSKDLDPPCIMHICVLNYSITSRTPLLQTSCTTNVALCHLIVLF